MTANRSNVAMCVMAYRREKCADMPICVALRGTAAAGLQRGVTYSVMTMACRDV